MKKIVVIGGGAAGAKAASKAKRLNPENYVEIFEKGKRTSVSLCGLPYFLEGTVKDINDLIIRTPEEFIQNGIPVYTGYELQEIYPEKNAVLVNGNHIFYDELIIATGASVKIPNIENINCNNVFTLRSIEDGLKIKEKMLNSKSAIILGGGYSAIEVAQAFVKNGLKTYIIESKPNLLNDFDEEFSKDLKRAMASISGENIEIITGETVEKFTTDENNNFKSAKTSSGKEFFADFCTLSTGISPNIEAARKAGIKIGVTGAIYVDSKMRTNIQNIYAAGDCAQKYSITTKKPLYIGLGSIASKEGRVASINATGGEFLEFFNGILASAITSYFGYTISKTGLTGKRALELSKEINLEPIASTVIKKDKAGYMPQSNNMMLKLIADKRSGELLGAQGAGCANIVSRINTITSLLKTRAVVEDLLNLDLPYAPPFSGSVDIVLTCAYQLKELLKE